MTNVPVRFVRADGQTIQLPVTTLTLDVDRGTMAMPLPFMGSSRLGVDLNLSKAVILMEGVFTDDDLFNIGTPTASSSIIDFSRVDTNGSGSSSIDENTRFDIDQEIEIILNGRTVDNLTGVNTGIKLKSTDGTIKILYGTKSSESHSYNGSIYQFSIGTTHGIQVGNLAAGGSGYSIGNNIATSGGTGTNCKVNITGVNSGAVTSFTIAHPGKNFGTGQTITISGGNGDATFTVSQVGTTLTATQMATNLVSLINDGALSTPINEFSASLVPSPRSGESDVAVRITQIVTGTDGDNATPVCDSAIWNNTYWKPHINTFDGGSNAEGVFHGMSAGDKVMSLYATLNNSNNPGITGALVRGVGGRIADMVVDTKWGDYIMGIQIPFNSTVNAEDGQKYKPVNFFMPTGMFEHTGTKSVNNAVSASTEVSNVHSNNDRAFIKGFVTKATFVQIGGEPVYTFNIQFTPASIII